RSICATPGCRMDHPLSKRISSATFSAMRGRFCGRHLLAAKQRCANIDAAAGAVEETARIVAQIRTQWPKMRIVLRADSGFARDALMSWCEANGVDFLFGLAKNERLVGEIASELVAAEEESKASRQPARRFKEFQWSTREIG